MLTEIKKEDCALSIPYPEITVSAQNIAYARQLQIPYAGHASEMTAITTYMYQSILFSTEDCKNNVRRQVQRKSAQNVLAAVTVQEMHHLKTLGTLIAMLGGKPVPGVCHRGQYTHWNGSYTNTEEHFFFAMRQNIADEEAAAAEYEALSESICDMGVRAVLRRIAKDERHHAELFRKVAEM